MTHPFEHEPYDHDQILNDLEFTPEPPSIEEQHLALMDLQRTFRRQWIDDPNGFMVRLIMRLDADIDLNSPLVHIYPGLQFKETALGERTEELVVLQVRKNYIVPAMTPGRSPNMRSTKRNLPIVSAIDDTKRRDRKFADSDIDLIKQQIETLRGLQTLCPNLSDDLMTIVPTPGKDLERPWRSEAYIAARAQK
jgi:hypothetical protein